jgi:hypothetical protein
MKVHVYVEGPSDKASMERLLAPMIEKKKWEGISIEFFEAPRGDKKTSVLEKVPRKAVNILVNDPEAVVVALPDLYPKNKAFPHETDKQLQDGIVSNFRKELRNKGINEDERIISRFRAFCFKHDLEALLLAAEDALRRRIGARTLQRIWKLPVEDQDHDVPPKRKVETLFARNNKKYVDTVDAPLILSSQDYDAIADLCPQCFKPFVEFLSGLGSGSADNAR